ncbi:MAG: radical SAM protein [Deltaproteobacteria bacterium]|jgi:MoaA/NifB/PqqE/SkfB family radical SAM enzyme|nr:radical SAM protein [Deltaproteobacteria bacterium]
MLSYRLGPESDPFYYIFSDREWLADYDPAREFPFWLNLEPTNVCQLDCLFCSRRLSTRPLGYMGDEVLEKVVREAGRWPGAAIRFTGWGEPLLHPRLLEFAGRVKEEGIKLKIYTNGLALTEKLMEGFLRVGLDELQFSQQGITPRQYEFNRRGARSDVMRAKALMAARMRGAAPLPFLSVLTSVLEDELREGDSQAYRDEWLRSVDKVAIDLTNLNFVREAPDAKEHLARQSAGLTRGRCVDVFLALEIKYDGAIEFCGQDANASPSHAIGRVGEMGLREAFHSPRMEAQRDLVGRALGHAQSPVCQNCYHNTRKYDLFKEALGDPR